MVQNVALDFETETTEEYNYPEIPILAFPLSVDLCRLGLSITMDMNQCLGTLWDAVAVWHWTWRKRKPYRLQPSLAILLCLVLVTNNCLVTFVHSYPTQYSKTSRSTIAVSSKDAISIFTVNAMPSQTECDWIGRGSSSSSTNTEIPPTTTEPEPSQQNLGDLMVIRNQNMSSPSISSSSSSGQTDYNNVKLVQTISLRCSSGQILWQDPKGGLKVTIAPNVRRPYNLCLDNKSSIKSVRFLLEVQRSSSKEGEEEEEPRLLPILTRTSSKCYQVYETSNELLSSSTTIYIETHSNRDDLQQNNVILNNNGIENVQEEEEEDGHSQSQTQHENIVSLAYEVEPIKGDGDPCRPCSESEVLATYCTADAVAKGSIVQIRPPNEHGQPGINPDDTFESVLIKSDLVIHQTQPLFIPYKKLSDFINNDEDEQNASSTFNSHHPIVYNTNQPQRASRSLKGTKNLYGGVIHHPSKCSISIGSGEEFLWLIKFRFGKPMSDCVIYWDDWLKILQRNKPDCPVLVD